MNLAAQSYQPPVSCMVYTPAKLAEAMIAALGRGHDATWLEPSVGQGVFLDELCRRGVVATAITAIDIDPTPSEADPFANVRRGVDFLVWCAETSERFDRVVANPPYVSLLELPEQARTVARQLTLPSGGGMLPGRSNLWAAFVMGALRLLRPNGSMAVVLPAAWDYADYAKRLRDEVPALFAEWYCFRCEEPLFPDVSEGAVVIVGRGFGQPHATKVRCLCLHLDDLVKQLKLLEKSSGSQNVATAIQKQAPSAEGQSVLADLVEIRLGGVTGDVGYFLLTETRRRELELPIAVLKPVLSKACQLRAALIDRQEWDKLRDEDHRIWLFRPAGEHCKHASVRRYLRLAREKGGCNKDAYKISSRDPWYQVPLPQVVDGFMSGMCSHGPWLALSAMPRLAATNTLYTVRFKKRTTLGERAAIALSLISSPVRKQLPLVCRRYAAGLPKFEPGDLQALQIPPFDLQSDPLAAFQTAIQMHLSDSNKEATEIADRCLGIW